METPAPAWTDWWDRQAVYRDVDGARNAEVLWRSTQDLLRYGPSDVLLDLGGGGGHFAQRARSVVAEVHLADTSRRALDAARARLEGASGVHVHLLDPERYTDLSFLPARSFSIVVCCSVVQYYRGVEEVRALLGEVRRLLQPGGRFLLADLPTHRSTLRETWGLLRSAWRTGYLRPALRLLWRTGRSDYARVRRRAGLTVFSPDDLRALAAGPTWKGTLVDEPLTLLRHRRHLLFTVPAEATG